MYTLIVILFTCVISSSAVYTLIYIGQNCGDERTPIVNDNVVLMKEDVRAAASPCRVLFDITPEYKLLAKPRFLRLDSNHTTCETDYMTMTNGKDVTVLAKFCRTYHLPDLTYSTTSTLLDLKLYQSASIDPENYFIEVLVTRYRDGVTCDPAREFACDNGRCIGSSLKLDGDDNCGDNSDERHYYNASRELTMNDYCLNGSIYNYQPYVVSEAAIFLQYASGSDLRSSCIVAFNTKFADEQFSVKVLGIDLRNNNCSSNHVEVRDSYGGSTLPLGIFCNNSTQVVTYYSTWGALTLDYESTTSNDSFRLLITKYMTGKCDTHTEFICDNKRCIGKSLMCDGFDNCGDDSDEIRGCQPSNSTSTSPPTPKTTSGSKTTSGGKTTSGSKTTPSGDLTTTGSSPFLSPDLAKTMAIAIAVSFYSLITVQ